MALQRGCDRRAVADAGAGSVPGGVRARGLSDHDASTLDEAGRLRVSFDPQAPVELTLGDVAQTVELDFSLSPTTSGARLQLAIASGPASVVIDWLRLDGP